MARGRPQASTGGPRAQMMPRGVHIQPYPLRDLSPEEGIGRVHFHPCPIAPCSRCHSWGYVTTNYEIGLVEARRVIWPDIPTTGYATWKDQDSLLRWYNGEILLGGDQAGPLRPRHLRADGHNRTHHRRLSGPHTRAGSIGRSSTALGSGTARVRGVRLQRPLARIPRIAGREQDRTAGAGTPRHLALIGLRGEGEIHARTAAGLRIPLQHARLLLPHLKARGWLRGSRRAARSPRGTLRRHQSGPWQ